MLPPAHKQQEGGRKQSKAGPEEAAQEPPVQVAPHDEKGRTEDGAYPALKDDGSSLRPMPSIIEKPTFSKEKMRVEIVHGPKKGNMIALTFDAGASPKPTPLILDVLRRYGLHCTFFLTGKWMEANPELTRRIAEEGHEIANHTYSHPDLRKLSDEQIKEQLDRAEQIARNTAGVSTKPFFRPPFGARDRRVKEVAAEAGFRSVYWSVDSWDAFKKGITADEIRERVLSGAKAGSVVLMHCGSFPTAEALPSIIEDLQSRGYHLVTVSQLLAGG